MGLQAHALPQVVQDSIRVLTLSPVPTAAANYIPATNIDINVSFYFFKNCIFIYFFLKTDLNEESVWHKIEEMIVTTAAANKPLVFKASKSLFTKENPTTDNPLAVQGGKFFNT